MRTAVALYSWRLMYWWKNRERAVRAFVPAHTRGSEVAIGENWLVSSETLGIRSIGSERWINSM